MIRLLLAYIFIIFCFLPALSVSAAEQGRQDTLTFVFDRPSESPTTQWLTLVYAEALQRMGLKFHLIQAPAKRSTFYTNTGQADGQLSRVYAYNEANPEMVRVEENHFIVNFTAFSADPTIKVTSWNDLRKREYFVDYRLGVVKCEKNLPAVVKADRLVATTNINQSFKKLFARKNTLYVDVESNVYEHMKTQDFAQILDGRKIYKAGVLEQTTTHAFLHKKHKNIAEELSSTLHTMKEEGLFDKYRQKVGLTPQELTW